ncbi:hypothetical protein DFJ58DRAFT_841062 [Suillus subalutaceus]|uniref:uncharacterized protein n=1 Tax=Suillus subalutaceus TaxID=48586 RepID=UPI001B87C321|nr:uncharacterized protein DFJ58DRAFT_841062 [Suillus subalutaceus]KAG1855630.1 hypothetical protein DFJ58DRAFT_841062 [Suillus subalutaceus]
MYRARSYFKFKEPGFLRLPTGKGDQWGRRSDMDTKFRLRILADLGHQNKNLIERYPEPYIGNNGRKQAYWVEFKRPDHQNGHCVRAKMGMRAACKSSIDLPFANDIYGQRLSQRASAYFNLLFCLLCYSFVSHGSTIPQALSFRVTYPVVDIPIQLFDLEFAYFPRWSACKILPYFLRCHFAVYALVINEFPTLTLDKLWCYLCPTWVPGGALICILMQQFICAGILLKLLYCRSEAAAYSTFDSLNAILADIFT